MPLPVFAVFRAVAGLAEPVALRLRGVFATVGEEVTAVVIGFAESAFRQPTHDIGEVLQQKKKRMNRARYVPVPWPDKAAASFFFSGLMLSSVDFALL